jgi:hypothetical protein
VCCIGSSSSTILEDEIFHSSNQGTRSPRSFQKLMRPLSPLARPTSPFTRSSSPPHSPLARKGVGAALASTSLPTSPARPTAAVASLFTGPTSPVESYVARYAAAESGSAAISSSSSSVSPLHSRSASQPIVVERQLGGVSSVEEATDPSSESSGSAGGGRHHRLSHAPGKTAASNLQRQLSLESAPGAAAVSPPVLPSRSNSPPPRPLKTQQSSTRGGRPGPSLVKAVSHNSHIFRQFSQVGSGTPTSPASYQHDPVSTARPTL